MTASQLLINTVTRQKAESDCKIDAAQLLMQRRVKDFKGLRVNNVKVAVIQRNFGHIGIAATAVGVEPVMQSQYTYFLN